MPDTPRHLRLVEDSAHRAHARTAIAGRDIVAGVLAERIAEYLCIQLRTLHGQRTAGLTQVPPGEALQMRGYARDIMRLVDEIAVERPPTPFEIAHVELATALALARSRVRCHASANRHRLSVWRPDPQRAGVEQAACEKCGAGASLHLATAQENISDELLTACPSLWRPW